VISNLLRDKQANSSKNREMEEKILIKFVKDPAFKDAVNPYANRLLAYAERELKKLQAFELIECLVEQEAAIGAAEMSNLLSNLLPTIERADYSEKSDAEKKLLSCIVKKGAFKDVVTPYADRLLAYAKRELQSPDFQRSNRAFKLIECLVEQEVIGAAEISNVLSSVLTSMERVDYSENSRVEELLNYVAKKATFKDVVNPYSDRLLACAKRGVQSCDFLRSQRAFKLIECLIKQKVISAATLISNLLTIIEKDSKKSLAEKKILFHLMLKKAAFKDAINQYSDRLSALEKDIENK
jgi:competence protein ComGF